MAYKRKNRRYNAVCKFCGTPNLRWIDTKVGYRLVSREGFHNCRPRTQDDANANPVGTTQTTEANTNGNNRLAESGPSDVLCELPSNDGSPCLDVGGTVEGEATAKGVRTQRHLTPYYWEKPRMHCCRYMGIGDRVWICTQVIDGERFNGMAYGPEVAYKRMRENIERFENCGVKLITPSEPKYNRRLAWVVFGIVGMIGMAILEYVRTH